MLEYYGIQCWLGNSYPLSIIKCHEIIVITSQSTILPSKGNMSVNTWCSLGPVGWLSVFLRTMLGQLLITTCVKYVIQERTKQLAFHLRPVLYEVLEVA